MRPDGTVNIETFACEEAERLKSRIAARADSAKLSEENAEIRVRISGVEIEFRVTSLVQAIRIAWHTRNHDGGENVT
jgi:hypothetical protein